MKIQTKLSFAFGIQLLFTIALGIGVLYSMDMVHHQFTHVVNQVNPNTKNAIQLSKLVIDMETGQRGFVITGKEEFLEPYVAGYEAFAILMKKQKQLVHPTNDSDHVHTNRHAHNQIERLERIERLVEEWQLKAAKPEIAMARKIASHVVDAQHLQDLLREGKGKRLMDEFMSLGHEIETSFLDRGDWEGAYAIEIIEKSMADREDGQRGFLITGKEEFLDKYIAGEQKKLPRYFARLRAIVSDRGRGDELSENVNQLEKLIHAWTEKAAEPEIAARREMNENPETLKDVAALLEAGIGKALLDEIRLEFDIFIKNEEKIVAREYSNSSETSAMTKKLSITLLLFATCLGALMAILASRAIARPITNLAHAIEIVASGDFSAELEVRSSDEIGDLTKSFNHMLRVRQLYENTMIESNRETQEALANLAEQKFAMDQHSIVAVTDIKGTITFVNDKFVEISGYSREELLGQNHRIINSGYHDKEFFGGMFRTITRGKVWNAEIRNRAKDGRIYWVDSTIVPFMGDNGKPQSYIAIRTDITERKQAEDELQSYSDNLREAKEQQEDNNAKLILALHDLELSQQQAEEANKAKSEFLANMSHEIRTPMNGIIGMTQLVLGSKLDKQQREFLDMVSQSADNLMTIINDILDFSKIEAGQLLLEQIDFSLRDAIEGAVEPLALKAHEKSIEIISFIDPQVPKWLSGDPTRLRQILINLLGNSIKFTDEGEILLRVEMEAEASMTQLHFSIFDTGIGIPEDKLETIFESFTQADGSTTRMYGGTGLGTTISKQLVEIMGGYIWIESPTNKSAVGGPGSTFHFTIPIVLAQSRPPAKETPTANLTGMKVLIVDDNTSNRILLTTLTESWAMLPTPVSSGEEALELLSPVEENSDGFSLILLDNIMPDMSGLQFAEKMRTDPRLRDTRIILLSSTGQVIENKTLEKLDISAFVSKPIKQSSLYNAIIDTMAKSCAWSAPDEQTADRVDTVGAGKKVLLVEDNKVNLMLAMKLLEKEGFQVEAAEDGRQAVDAVKSNTFDLIFMDIQMPVLNGYEATAKIRELQSVTGDSTPIIAMTANALQGDREKCLEAGMDDYISKPINPKKLRESILKHLSSKPVNQQT